MKKWGSRLLSRRNILTQTGVGALLSPFLLRDSKLFAQSSQKNVIFIYSPFGFRNSQMAPIVSSKSLKLEGPFAPLAEFSNVANCLVNLKYRSVGLDGGDPHQEGTGQVFSGIKLAKGNFGRMDQKGSSVGFGGGISLDQWLGNNLKPDSYRKSLYFGLFDNFELQPGNAISFSGINRPVLPILSSTEAFNDIFQGLQSGAEAAKKINEEISVLDVLVDDINSLNRELPKHLKNYLDLHLSSIRTMEKSLLASNRVCSTSQLGPKAQSSDISSWPRQITEFMDILVNSIACDLSRVGLFQFFGSRQGPNLAQIISSANAVNHSISHNQIANWQQAADDILKFYAESIATLLKKLRDTKDPFGQSLLDNTIVVWGTDSNWNSNDGGHTQDHIPYFTFGGSNLIKTEKFLDLKNKRFNNDLLLTVAQASGKTIESFGEKEQCNGPIIELLKA